MAKFSPRLVSDLQAIYLTEYGIVLTNEEAHELGIKIVRLVLAKELFSQKEYNE